MFYLSSSNPADVLTIQEPGKTNVVPVIRKPPEQNRSPPEQNISANPTEKDSSPSQNVIPEAVPPQVKLLGIHAYFFGGMLIG